MPEQTESDLLTDDAREVKMVHSDGVFNGAVWGVRRDEFAYGEGSLVREYVDHTGAVAILALDDEDNVLLIKQYRHPMGSRDWEIPAGLLDIAGEAPLAAAQRELSEEADVSASEWSVLSEFYTTPGGSNEAIRVYLARGVSKTAKPFERTAEEADIEKRWVPLDDVVDAVLARRTQNPSLTVAVLAAHVARERGWSTLGDANEAWTRHPHARKR